MDNKRILLNDKVYILYDDAINLIREHGLVPSKDVEQAIVSKTIGLDCKLALLEDDFNAIVSEYYPNKPLLIQYTFVDSLALKVEAIKGIYPLKMMIAKDMFVKKAHDANMSLEDYLQNVDLPEEVKKAYSSMQHRQRTEEKIKKYKAELEEVIPKDIFEKFGLTVQTLTDISTKGIGFRTYIVGNGIFYAYEPEFIRETLWETATEENGIISAVDYNFTSERFELKRVEGRDFRDYSVMDNIIYCLQNFKAVNEWQDYLNISHDGISVEAHINFLAKFFNSDNSKDEIYIEGIPKL